MNKNMPTTERTTLDGTSNDEAGVSSVLKPDIDDVVPTRERLLGLVDDVELITKELIENAIAPKPKKMSAQDHAELTQLLIQKDKELKVTMDLALEQGEVEKRIQAVQEEVKKQDEAVKELQKKLKEAETVLSTAIFQAKQKLDSIERANKNPVSSEDLIKYSHRISASNAACAPLTWQQGDPRRPYPTDIEMRLGFLGRPETMLLKSSTNGSQFAIGSQLGNNTTPVSSPMVPNIHQANTSPTKIPSSQPGGSQPPHIPPGASGHFAWRDGEMSMSMTEGGTIPIEIGGNLIGSPSVNPPVGGGKGVRMGHGGQEDVDVMSTDSSSSSSTDSN